MHNNVLHHEIVIDRSGKEVWPHLFDLNKWNPLHIGSKIERVSGELNKEGEVYLEYRKVDGQYIFPVTVELARVIEHKKIVLKVYPSDDKESYFFVDLGVHEDKGKTRFSFNSYAVVLMTEETLANYPSYKEFDVNLEKMARSLKAYVERF